MKAITVKQPWAWAILHGGKGVENRSTNIAGGYRGPLAIIAGKAVFEEEGGAYPEVQRAIWKQDEGYTPTDDELWEVADDVDPEDPRFVYGAIIGVVNLVDVHHGPEWGGGCHKYQSPVPVLPDYGLCSPWGDGGVLHLVLAEPRPLPTSIPYTGFLGCRELPADIVAQIEEQLR